jgi:oxalate decarboxylase/phosphoglucose isomerase-like protein (cupin superfamily)
MVIDGENHPMGSGDLVFIPAQRTHHAVNTGPGTLTLLWSVPSRWADVPGVADAFRAWPAVEPGSSWT